ncbi:hypothetical protein BC937DRAFT_90690 [Endogone sp. FLAS-F59071]|nr:hypothetical protein BC937DRAFT_90690 [Endogone sp. FLAS-F59071]|eukprot:RUS16889.1 hypothetical protein BC937DRAFT_90690 [Endogone sp. FLAS-F59071]
MKPLRYSSYEQPMLVNLPVPIRSISSGRSHAMALGKDDRLLEYSTQPQVAAGWGFDAVLTANRDNS